ncbi:aquaporin Z [Pseudomonas azotoformans]|uniref:Aquaporin Z n=1 Tax=Pseudomonas azotoformans TaxID=47878 RepID=A0A1V2JAJ0_PSEAZ|nr:aquaporin Z [Pseudomonas azotoformans]OIN50654.1 aquaporin Z [Pseudomonas azotoformans]ONH42180.1 aquaporin Z [Pseudomonas azotoformans]SDN37113.1 aquaporin Z [Pseudomonas azotoformans]
MELIVQKRLTAEFIGTFWLTFGGCGSAILAAAFPGLGIGFVGVSLAFGLTVLTMAYALGGISGGHFNPAVTIGLWVGRRIEGADVLPYIVAQVAGAITAAAALFLIANGQPNFAVGGFAANGYGPLSPGHFDMKSALLAELIATFFFVFIILRVTAPGAVPGFAPIAIGLALTLIHLVLIPVTNTSVNPARSTGPALFAGVDYLAQLWLFWLAPMVGGVMGAVAARSMDECRKKMPA